jgi:hypothetical protein
MSTMNLPGFTAEISLARMKRQYRSAASGLRNYLASGDITQQMQMIVETFWGGGFYCPPSCVRDGFGRCHCPLVELNVDG